LTKSALIARYYWTRS